MPASKKPLKDAFFQNPVEGNAQALQNVGGMTHLPYKLYTADPASLESVPTLNVLQTGVVAFTDVAADFGTWVLDAVVHATAPSSGFVQPLDDATRCWVRR